jgi:hypothetical protein
MQPAMPFGWNARRFGDSVVHHPSLAPRAGDHALVLEVAVAFRIGADEFAAHLGEEPGADDHEPTTLMVTAPLVRGRFNACNATREPPDSCR